MRGTLRRGNDKGHADGIIPAHAGNTGAPANDARAAWDHPRACGEHTSTGTAKVTVKGSSPRMRGTLNPMFYPLPTRGIIPAHAGNTGLGEFDAGHFGDHPRACGEHSMTLTLSSPSRGSSPRMRGTRIFLFSFYCLSGSSPRMRGTLFRHGLCSIPFGIIPAHAGNTGSARS